MRRCKRLPISCVYQRTPVVCWNPLPSWSKAAAKKRIFLNETHLLRKCLGRLSVLAENRQKASESRQQTDQGNETRTVRGCRQTGTPQTLSCWLLVSPN